MTTIVNKQLSASRSQIPSSERMSFHTNYNFTSLQPKLISVIEHIQFNELYNEVKELEYLPFIKI